MNMWSDYFEHHREVISVSKVSVKFYVSFVHGECDVARVISPCYLPPSSPNVPEETKNISVRMSWPNSQPIFMFDHPQASPTVCFIIFVVRFRRTVPT